MVMNSNLATMKCIDAALFSTLAELLVKLVASGFSVLLHVYVYTNVPLHTICQFHGGINLKVKAYFILRLISSPSVFWVLQRLPYGYHLLVLFDLLSVICSLACCILIAG